MSQFYAVSHVYHSLLNFGFKRAKNRLFYVYYHIHRILLFNYFNVYFNFFGQKITKNIRFENLTTKNFERE